MKKLCGECKQPIMIISNEVEGEYLVTKYGCHNKKCDRKGMVVDSKRVHMNV